MSKMKIAVTGGSGFIGSRLLKELIERRFAVINLDLRHPDTDDNRFETKLTDITKLEDVKKSLKDVDMVFHLAGPVLEMVKKDPYKSTLLSTLGTMNILESCRHNQVHKIIFASTFYVYDSFTSKMRVDEATKLDISRMNLFGVLKATAESLIKEYAKQYGMIYVILRFGSVFGAGNCTNAILTFINAARKDQAIEIWGQGKRKNQYTYIDDIIQGCIASMDKDNQVYNLVDPHRTRTIEVARILQQKYHTHIILKRERKEAASMAYISSKKAQTELDWKPQSLKSTINKMIREISL